MPRTDSRAPIAGAASQGEISTPGASRRRRDGYPRVEVCVFMLGGTLDGGNRARARRAGHVNAYAVRTSHERQRTACAHAR